MNKLGSTILICVYATLICQLPAQSVSFTYSPDVLNLLPGFGSYSDCIVDMNGDQLDDVVRIGGKGIFIDYQQPDGTFEQSVFTIPVTNLPDWSICSGDLNNDGFNDLLLAGSSGVSMVLAVDNGDMYTENVMPVTIYCQRSTMADIDNDGWLDAFVCNETGGSVPFRNTGAGHMIPDTDLIHTANLPGNYAAIWTDFDNDRDIDLYITKCYGISPPGDVIRTNLLYRNNNDGTYTEVGEAVGLNDNAQSWSTVFEDFDNDGDFDVFIVNHDFQNRLFRNNGNGTFTDVILTSGIDPIDLGAFENASGDFNNDGFIDIFAELSSPLYLSNGDLTFNGQGAAVMPGAIGDLNNDGFLDVLRNGQVWLNNGGSNHWLKVCLQGLISNRSGIGSRVEIYGEWGKQTREIRSGQSFSPMSSLAAYFGLGEWDHVDSLAVIWPSGIRTLMTQLHADSIYRVWEASCALPSSVITVNGKSELCPGDITQLIAPEGYSAYTWSNGDSGQVIVVSQGGLYEVALQDSVGCISISETIRITQTEDQVPIITAYASNHICEGDSLVLRASPANVYWWSEGSTSEEIVVTAPGNYSVSVQGYCSGDTLVSELFDVIALPAPVPVVTSSVIVPGDSVLLMAIGEDCVWYDDPIAGNILHEGCTFQTSAIDSAVTYYVESHHQYPGGMHYGGKVDTSGEGGVSAQAGYLLFDVWEPFTLNTVTVFVTPGAPQGVRFVQLYSGDTLLASKQFEVHTGENILELNFYVPVGTHSIQCMQGNLFRNSGPLQYPYSIGSSGQITGSSFGTDYYYYFYHWSISTPDYTCISQRVPVDITVTSSHDTQEAVSVKIFPNPADDHLYVELKDTQSQIEIRIFNLLGERVYAKPLQTNAGCKIDVQKWPSGYYILQIVRGMDIFSTNVLIL